jgi:hypothetical protein
VTPGGAGIIDQPSGGCLQKSALLAAILVTTAVLTAVFITWLMTLSVDVVAIVLVTNIEIVDVTVTVSEGVVTRQLQAAEIDCGAYTPIATVN